MSIIHRKDMVIKKNPGVGLLDTFDNMVKEYLRITDDELDYICQSAADDELALLTKGTTSFVERRMVIEILNKYIDYG